MVHIGKLIEAELDRQHLTRAWLAKAIFCTRPYINTDSLALISDALKHNFFADMADDYEKKNQHAIQNKLSRSSPLAAQ